MTDPGYALSSSADEEHARLSRQSELYEPFTRRLLQRAGVESGMRVLDVGCGPGDVSFLLSELVGAGGSVVGVERDEQAVATARRRAAESGIGNVEFECGDFRVLEAEGEPFDAMAGRLVLQYQGDPASAVRSAAHHVRPGGVVVFAEMNLLGSPPERLLATWPPTPAYEQLGQWMHEAFATLGTQPEMGMRLPETFAQAGLEPSPDLDVEVAIRLGEDGVDYLVEIARSLLPTILDAGIATDAQVEIDTLAERLRADSGPAGRVMCWPPMIGAFATKPSGALP